MALTSRLKSRTLLHQARTEVAEGSLEVAGLVVSTLGVASDQGSIGPPLLFPD
jgi:hypothetical protein